MSAGPFSIIPVDIDADMIKKKFTGKTIYCIVLAAGLISSNLMQAATDVTQDEANQRVKDLKTANSAADSIEILLDVYQLSDKVNSGKVGKQILEITKRTGNHVVLGDVINELAATTDDTKVLARLIEMSENIPESEGKKTVETVLHMEQSKADAANSTGKDLQEKTLDYARIGMSLTGDPYEEIRNIYRALVFLGTSSMGPMYYEYIRRLEDLVSVLPENDYAIKNLYYTTAALYYTRKRDYKKAIENDRKLISQLDKMAEAHEKNGLSSRNLDVFYYVSYRRMLRNFRGLTPEEIEDVFNKCVKLAEQNDEVAEAFGNGGLTKSYYYYATKQYDKAIPELKKALEAKDISDFRKQELLGLLAGSYRNTGNDKQELETLRKYTTMMLADRRQRLQDTYKEIELRNTVTKLLAEEFQEAEKQKEENRVMRKTSLTLVYVLAVILIFICRGYFKMKNKVSVLESRNRKLHTNLEQIFDDGTPMGTRDLRRSKDRLKG